MRISDWSSDVCSSDLTGRGEVRHRLSVGLDPGRAAGCGGGRQCPEKWNAGGVGSLSQVSVHAPGAGNHRKQLLSSAQSSGRGEVDRKSCVSGKGVSVRVDRGGRRIIKKKKKTKDTNSKV